jgi:hypothetical protein
MAASNIVVDQSIFDALLINQIYCLSSQFSEVRISAVNFLLEEAAFLTDNASFNLKCIVDKANRITSDIKKIQSKDALFNEFSVNPDRNIVRKVEEFIWSNFERNCESANQTFESVVENISKRKWQDSNSPNQNGFEKIQYGSTRIDKVNSTINTLSIRSEENDPVHIAKEARKYFFLGLSVLALSCLLVTIGAVFSFTILVVVPAWVAVASTATMFYSLLLVLSIPKASRTRQLIISEIKKLVADKAEIERRISESRKNIENQRMKFDSQNSQERDRAEYQRDQEIQHEKSRRDSRIEDLARIVKMLEDRERLHEMIN